MTTDTTYTNFTTAELKSRLEKTRLAIVGTERMAKDLKAEIKNLKARLGDGQDIANVTETTQRLELAQQELYKIKAAIDDLNNARYYMRVALTEKREREEAIENDALSSEARAICFQRQVSPLTLSEIERQYQKESAGIVGAPRLSAITSLDEVLVAFLITQQGLRQKAASFAELTERMLRIVSISDAGHIVSLVKDVLKNAGQFERFMKLFEWDVALSLATDAPSLDDINRADGYVLYEYRDAVYILSQKGVIDPADIAYDAKLSSYSSFVSSWWAEMEKELSPFRCSWASKTDEETRQNPWCHMFDGPPMVKEHRDAWSQAIADVSPSLKNGAEAALGAEPADVEFMSEISESLVKKLPWCDFVIGDPADEKTLEFSMSVLLPFMAGLGPQSLRTIMQAFADQELHGADHYATLDDAELIKEVLAARATSGFPIALTRVDFTAILGLCALCGRIPRFVRFLLLLHVLTYCRVTPDGFGPGMHTFSIRYGGQFIDIPFEEKNRLQSLAEGHNDAVNGKLRQAMTRHLGLHIEGEDETKELFAAILQSLWKLMRPDDFLVTRKTSLVPCWIVPPRVVTRQVARRDHASKQWADPGFIITGVRIINLNNGHIERCTISGADAVAYSWPTNKVAPKDNAIFYSILPKKVEAALPSTVLKPYILNLDFLGFEDGCWLGLDTVLMAPFIRQFLPAAPISLVLAREFPMVYTTPGSTESEAAATNTGKSFFGHALARIGEPRLPRSKPLGLDSPPAQRASARVLRIHGTAFYDEFVPPRSSDHFLSKDNIVAAATSGQMDGPGLAKENADSIYLYFSLFFTTKVMELHPDLLNRALILFMLAYTEETKSTDRQFEELSNGALSLRIRLSLLFWMVKSGFLDKAKTIASRSGTWRFNGHNAVASLINPTAYPQMLSYFKASESRCYELNDAALESGVLESMTGRAAFNPKDDFNQLNEMNIELLAIDILNHGPLAYVKILEVLYGGAGTPDFHRNRARYEHTGTSYRKQISQLKDKIKSGLLVREDGWYFLFYSGINKQLNNVPVFGLVNDGSPGWTADVWRQKRKSIEDKFRIEHAKSEKATSDALNPANNKTPASGLR